MLKKYILVLSVLAYFSLHSTTASAANTVVVVPLGGAVGNAAAIDVIKGKTFSSRAGKGLIGTRPPSPIATTGQTISWGTGDDGALEKGVSWPNPRFTDNSNGTVTDNLTGLIWLKNASCFGWSNWETALTDANTLNSGECGLNDSSVEGDWRLPNVIELFSLIDFREIDPALPSDHPFLGVVSGFYWSSTTYSGATVSKWQIDMYYGGLNITSQVVTRYVWPVRGGL